ncbi:hypothetical protein [Streptomyces sp. NPDC001774]
MTTSTEATGLGALLIRAAAEFPDHGVRHVRGTGRSTTGSSLGVTHS